MSGIFCDRQEATFFLCKIIHCEYVKQDVNNVQCSLNIEFIHEFK